jgi:hypothetical protein
MPSTEIEAIARREFKRIIEEHPACRAKLLRWTLLGEELDIPSAWRTETCARLGRVWDGMRRLPYTDEQLAAALAATLALSANPTFSSSSIRLELASAGEVPSEWVTSRAAAEASSLQAAFRSDLATILRQPELINEPKLLFQVLQSPMYVYEFDKLVDLFAREIIPSQVLLRRSDLAVFYSPATVAVIGIE